MPLKSYAKTKPEEIIGAIYNASMDPAGWGTVVEGIRQLVGGSTASLLTPMASPTAGGVLISEQISPEDLSQLTECIQSFGDPWLPAWRAHGSPVGTVTLCSELLTDEQALESDLYWEWIEPRDLVDFAHLVLYDGQTPQVPMLMLGVSRSPKEGTFSRTHIDLLNALAPHLRRALDINRIFARNTIVNQANQAVLDALAVGLLHVRADQTVAYANPRAESILARNDGLSMRGGRLEAVLHEDTGKLQTLLARAVDPSSRNTFLGAGQILLPQPSGKGHLAVTVTPLPAEMSFWRGADAPAALVQVSDGQEAPPIAPDLLRKRYRLTAAESEVMVALISGETVQQIAARRGTVVSTVRIHIERIYAKTGVRRQAELVKLGHASNVWITPNA